jgi:CheY-like chemotaxis protein
MTQIVTLLIVEDDAFDFKSMERTLSEMKVSNPVIHAKDGLEALDILRGENGAQKLEHPYLIFLDLKMPNMDGLEFLTEIRADDALKDSTVFIFTSSESDSDIKSADKFNVAGFILKSDMEGSFTEAAESLGFSWCIVANN